MEIARKNNIVRIMLYILKKLLKLVSILFAISIICYILMAFSPLDPLTQYLGGESAVVSEEHAQKIADNWGFNDSYVHQYITWIGNIMHGDLGKSSTYNQPVIDVIKERVPASLLLMTTAWIITGITGFVLGIIAGLREGKASDKIIKYYSLIMASAPTFWLGLVLMIVFSVNLGWFPVAFSSSINASGGGSMIDRINHLVLPALTLSLSGVASIALHTREKLVGVFKTDYMLFSAARGEKKFTAFRKHGFRNVILPAITIQFASLSEIFGGSSLVEKVFGYPGIGNAVVTAGIKGDIPLLVGISLFSTVFVFTGNLIADILYHVIDPRIREDYSNVY